MRDENSRSLLLSTLRIVAVFGELYYLVARKLNWNASHKLLIFQLLFLYNK
jgi:hypothetical protein